MRGEGDKKKEAQISLNGEHQAFSFVNFQNALVSLEDSDEGENFSESNFENPANDLKFDDHKEFPYKPVVLQQFQQQSTPKPHILIRTHERNFL